MKSSPSNGHRPLVYIIILHFNNTADTISCLISCRKIMYENFRMLVVDNSGAEGSGFQQEETVDILQTGKNLGYAGGMNVGIRHALKEGAEYVWLLNNDTVVDGRCLDHMVRAAESDERVGMVGPKIYYLDKPDAIWYAGGEVALERGGLTSHIGKDIKDDGSYNERSVTEYVTGCSILTKRQMIEDVGLLDEKYFLYFEDADWSLRARQRGWKLIYEPNAKVWHKEGAQSEKAYSPRFIYYTLRNRLYFMKRFAPEYMLRCHLLQMRSVLFFIKMSFKKNMFAWVKTLGLAFRSYRDFFLYKRMGRSKAL